MNRHWTVLCKAPGDGRGQYSEEIDVEAKTPGVAKRLAQEVLDRDHVAGMRAVRVIRGPEVMIVRAPR